MGNALTLLEHLELVRDEPWPIVHNNLIGAAILAEQLAQPVDDRFGPNISHQKHLWEAVMIIHMKCSHCGTMWNGKDQCPALDVSMAQMAS